jgi:hypothetical protein
MPDKTTMERARRDRRQGKSPTTQAGEFVREEIEKIRRGEHGARSPEQAIALAFRRRAAPACRCGRRAKAKSRSARGGARNTPTRPASTSAAPDGGRGSPARSSARSSASRAARSRAAHSRATPSAPRRAARLPTARRRPARRRAPRPAAAARRRQKRRHARARGAVTERDCAALNDRNPGGIWTL